MRIDVPEGWEIKQLREISFVTAGGTPSTKREDFWSGDIPWMSSGELNFKKIKKVKGKITEKGLNHSSAKLIKKYSLLIGLAGQGKTRGTVAYNEIELCR